MSRCEGEMKGDSGGRRAERQGQGRNEEEKCQRRKDRESD